jgi:hypothetical protein
MPNPVAGLAEEPTKWAVVMLFDGEVLGSLQKLYTDPNAVHARVAELQDRYPRHEVRVVRRDVTWTEEPGTQPVPIPTL